MSSEIFVATTERALALLGGVLRWTASHPPRADLLDTAEDVSRAMAAIYDARDERRDPLGAIEAAQARLALATASLDPEGDVAVRLAEALGELMTASRFAPQASPTRPDERRTISVGVPHAGPWTRSSVAPIARVLPMPPDAGPKDPSQESPQETGAARVERIVARLRADKLAPPTESAVDETSEPPELPSDAPVDPSANETPGAHDPLVFGARVDTRMPAHDEASFVRDWARSLCEEMAALGMQRVPLKDDDWRARGFIEERLLSCLDAFVGLGVPALSSLERFVLDAPAPDPWRVFSVGLVAGALGDRDLAGVFEAAARHVGADDPDVRTAWVAASRLSPSDGLVSMQRTLLGDASPAIRALALEGLIVKGAATTEELLAAASGEDATLTGLALPMLATRRRAEVTPLALEARRQTKNGALMDAANRALLLTRHKGLPALLVEALDGPGGERAALLLALTGDADGARRLEEAARTKPTVGRALALGWAGYVRATPTLLAMLTSPDEDIADAAARALARICGEAPIEEREIDPESLAEPDLKDPPMVEGDSPANPPPTSRAFEVPDAGSPDRINAFSRDPELWAPLVAAVRERQAAAVRVRFGQPFSVARSLDELEQDDVPVPSTAEERGLAFDEICFHTDAAVVFDPEQWVSVQKEQLRAIRSVVGD